MMDKNRVATIFEGMLANADKDGLQELLLISDYVFYADRSIMDRAKITNFTVFRETGFYVPPFDQFWIEGALEPRNLGAGTLTASVGCYCCAVDLSGLPGSDELPWKITIDIFSQIVTTRSGNEKTRIRSDEFEYLIAILIDKDGLVSSVACIDDEDNILSIIEVINRNELNKPIMDLAVKMVLLTISCLHERVEVLTNSPNHSERKAVAKNSGFNKKIPDYSYHWLNVSPSKNGRSPARAKETGKGGERPLHSVRRHMRHLANGKIVMVKPHWRGKKSIGIVKKGYKVSKGN